MGAVGLVGGGDDRRSTLGVAAGLEQRPGARGCWSRRSAAATRSPRRRSSGPRGGRRRRLRCSDQRARDQLAVAEVAARRASTSAVDPVQREPRQRRVAAVEADRPARPRRAAPRQSQAPAKPCAPVTSAPHPDSAGRSQTSTARSRRPEVVERRPRPCRCPCSPRSPRGGSRAAGRRRPGRSSGSRSSTLSGSR